MFDRILAGHYEQWKGLSNGLTVNGLASKTDAAVAQPIAKNRIASRFRVYELQRRNPPRQLEAWIAVGEKSVAIVEIEDPLCDDVERTLAELGTPETVLEDKRVVVDYTVREFVYANRGMVLSVGQPSPVLEDSRRRLLHVRLFPSMTLQSYLTEVGESRPALPNTHRTYR